MNGVKIEKGIPAPVFVGKGDPGRGRFAGFEVGDSAFFANGNQQKLSTLAASHGKRHHQKFMSRIVAVNGVRGVRIWRIE